MDGRWRCRWGRDRERFGWCGVRMSLLRLRLRWVGGVDESGLVVLRRMGTMWRNEVTGG